VTRLACLAGVAAFALPLVAGANVFEVFGPGARSQALAGATTALEGRAASAWQNPAALADAVSAVEVGLFTGFDRTAILMTPRPRGYDPPGYGSRASARRDMVEPPPVSGMTVGVTLPLERFDLTLGGVVYLPFSGLAHATSRFADEREQHFTNGLEFDLLGERLRSEVIAAGLAYRAASWVSLGVGVTFLPAARSVTRVWTPNPTDPATVDINPSLEQSLHSALMAGLVVRPTDGVRVAASFQDEVFFGIDGHNEVRLATTQEDDADPIIQPLDLVVHHSPARLRLGVAWEAEPWVLSLEGGWVSWSRWLDSHGKEAGLADTYVLSTGFEYRTSERTVVRVGLGWQPSPVPGQTGRTNFVDNDRVVVAVGAGHELRLWGDEVAVLDLAVQVQSLRPVEVTKAMPADGDWPDCAPGVTSVCDEVPDQTEDTPLLRATETRGLQTGNPGFPGYAHGGYLVAASLDLTWRF